MIDVFKRALQHPLDYHRVAQTTALVFRKKIEEPSGVWSFIFTPTQPLVWQAGQHAIFSMPGRHVSGKTWRPFSVASSMHEGIIRIGTNLPPTPSDFKQKLASLAPGDTIRMHGPFGEFHAHKKPETIVGIAGGIGITPFRSIAYEIAHGQLPTKLHLIYSARAEHTYRSELDSWCAMTDKLTIEYIHTPEEVSEKLAQTAATYKNTVRYFLSGAPGMITSLITECRAQGITRIVNDPFKGY